MTQLNDHLQRLLDRAQKAARANAVLLHIRSGDGGIDFAGGAGEADPGSRFPVASISKMFTAAMIRQLFDEGSLGPDQTVQGVLPHLDLSGLHVVKGVDHGPRLTIRQLLFQTSGLADYYEGGVAEDLLRGKDYAYDLPQVLDWARRRPPQAAPDSGKAHYSDTNYQLLGRGHRERDGTLLRRGPAGAHLRPLGLTPHGAVRPARDGNGRTLPVYHKALRLDIPLILSSMGPDGGIVSDTGDLMTFLRAFMDGRLFRPDTLPALSQGGEAPPFPAAVRRRPDAVQAARMDDALAALAGTDRPFRGKRDLRLSRTGAGHLPCRHLQPDRCAETPLRLHAASAPRNRRTPRRGMKTVLK
jgi:D-alanyl-D-alanine carboxypeptidase